MRVLLSCSGSEPSGPWGSWATLESFGALGPYGSWDSLELFGSTEVSVVSEVVSVRGSLGDTFTEMVDCGGRLSRGAGAGATGGTVPGGPFLRRL